MADAPPGPWSDAGDLSGLRSPTADHPFAVPEGRRYARGAPLGTGGMGTVHRALDGRLLREVALKCPSEGPGAAAARQRLAQEAWVTAQLDHPGVVSVHDAGLDPDGQPFYIMRLIEGETLNELLTEPALDTRLDLLRHLRDVCEAVGYAHRRGFVHRDLKPANVMVGRFGETQVMDWGLARPAPGPLGDRWRKALPAEIAAETVTGTVVGTPSYLSPEQAEGGVATAASDVWSLGVVLHELLSGQCAFRGPSARDILTQVRQARLPPLPDDLPSSIAPLASVIRRATAPAPEARFADAKEMADELTRFLEGGRVEAHRYTPTELLRATVLAWRGPLLLAGVVVLAASFAVASALRDARQEAARATEAESQALAAQADADANLQQALVAQALTAAAAGDRGRAETLAAHALGLGEDPRARGILLDGRPRPRYLGAVDAPACAELDMDQRGRWLACQGQGQLALWDLASGEQRWSRPVVTASRPKVDVGGWVASTSRLTQHSLIDPRGHLLNSAQGSGTPTWRPGDTGLYMVKNGLIAPGPEASQRLHDCPGGSADAHAASADHLVGVCFGEVFLRRGDTFEVFETLPITAERGFPSIAAATDTLLVWGTQTGHLVAHALPSGALLWERSLEVGALRDLALSPDGQQLAVLGTRLGLHQLDTATGETRWVLPELPHQAAVGIDEAGHVVLLAEQLHRWQLPGNTGDWPVSGGVTSMDFSRDGTLLAVGHGEEASLLDWGSQRWTLLSEALGGTIKSVDFAPTESDGLVIGLPTRTLLYDDPSAAPQVWPMGSRRMGLLSDGRVIFGGYGTSGPGLLRMDGRAAPSISLPNRPVADLETAPDGTHAVWATEDGVWEVTLPELETRLVLPLTNAAVAARSRDLVVGASRSALSVAPRVPDGEAPGWTRSGFEHRVLEARVTPDSSLVVTGHADGSVRLFDAATGEVRAELRAHAEQVPALAIHPDGGSLVTASWDRTVRRWELARLDQPAEDLLDEVTATWGLSLERALR